MWDSDDGEGETAWTAMLIFSRVTGEERGGGGGEEEVVMVAVVRTAGVDVRSMEKGAVGHWARRSWTSAQTRPRFTTRALGGDCDWPGSAAGKELAMVRRLERRDEGSSDDHDPMHSSVAMPPPNPRNILPPRYKLL